MRRIVRFWDNWAEVSRASDKGEIGQVRELSRRSFLGGVMGFPVALPLGFFLTDLKGAKATDKRNTFTVTITDLKFIPEQIEVELGDEIIWINRDISPHTASSLRGAWDTGELGLIQQRSLVVTKVMVGEYYCRFHPHMRGRITLKSSA